MKSQKKELIEKITREILSLLEVEAKVEITEKGEIININLQTNKGGILIGRQGNTLYSLQFLISLIVFRKIGEWPRVNLEINEYRRHREETLKKLALSVARRVKISQKEKELPPMNSQERRIIHLALAEDPEVTTESRGEGKERRVVIKPCQRGNEN